MPFTLTAIQQAWSLKDPALVDYMVSLAQQKYPQPIQPIQPIRDEALTFPRFLRTIFSHSFRQLSAEEQYNYRVEQLALLTADDAEVPLSDSLKLHSLILFIYADDSFYARRVLIEIIRTLPLQYGVWKAFKTIYKDVEKKADHQLLGELIARFDTARANNDASISQATLLYIVRRGWRYLRKLIALCDSKYADVREFIHDALLAEPTDENKRYRLSATTLDVSAVYQFCHSKKAQTRQLGMQIIQQYETFQQPETLFQLTESSAREVRSFVVRILWSLYRRYATTRHWKPYTSVLLKGTKALQKKQHAQQQQQGTGLPQRPQHLPANKEALQQLLQRWLYELPPGGFASQASASKRKHLKPLSACLAKKALIETFRDLALEDDEFARMVLPLLQNFTQSRGAMEQAACLVAVTRIEHFHPQLATRGA